jgi:hypothetical protein
MPRKIPGVTRQDLVSAILPPATKTYTVISHNFVITNVLQMLSTNGFEVKEEVYRCTKDAQVASGIYRINYEDDPDLGMMFAFGNSYDKSMRFKCAVGAYIYANQSSMINKMSDWNRKHTGTADAETQETIESQVNNAMVYYNELREQKNLMKDIEADPLVFGKLLGELYFNLKLLTGEQMAIIKREYEKPSFTYTTGKNNLWTLYNHILVALKISHPRTWMEQQTAINYKIAMDFNLIKFDEDETADEKVSSVSSAGTGNAGMFLPGFGKNKTNEFNPNNNEIKPIHEILELDAEDAFANEPIIGNTKDVTAEELIEEYGQDISKVDSITIQNNMTVGEALETYPEMIKEIVEAAGVEHEVVEEISMEVEEIEAEEEITEEEIHEVISNDTTEELAEVEIVPEVIAEDGTKILDEAEATEEEINHMLHGVDNNPEVVISEIDPAGDEDHIDGVDELPEEVEEEVTVLDLSPEPVDLDAEENEDWDKLEKAGIIEPEELVELEEISEEEELEEIVDMEPVEVEVTTEKVIEALGEVPEKKEPIEKPVESTGVLFDIEDNAHQVDLDNASAEASEEFIETEKEVVPGIEPIAEMTEPVEIMSPTEAKEKSKAIETQDKTSELYITIKTELLELYGYAPDFTYTEKDSQYNVVLESGETVVLSAAYIDSLDN